MERCKRALRVSPMWGNTCGAVKKEPVAVPCNSYQERTCSKCSSLPLQFDISKCHYLVDLDTVSEAPREPRYAANKDEWISIAYKPFLDSSR